MTDKLDETLLSGDTLLNEVALALSGLIDAITYIRGVDVEFYAPKEFRVAYKVLAEYQTYMERKYD